MYLKTFIEITLVHLFVSEARAFFVADNTAGENKSSWLLKD